MESDRSGDLSNLQGSSSDERRAAHVKWDGKTIALGTFSAAEAAEKCERAKALTKKWRATMVPKPGVEWVKKALERLQIRVVNDRPGRRKKHEVVERERNKKASETMYLPPPSRSNQSDHSMRSFANQYNAQTHNDPQINPLGTMSGGMVGHLQRRFSNTSGSGMVQQRYSPIQQVPSAASTGFERFQIPQSQSGNVPLPNEFSMNNSTANPPSNLSGSSRQHYQILKEHHDNLLKELQQTTYMMNMYQQNYEDRSQQEQENSNVMRRQGAMFQQPSNPQNNAPSSQRRPSFPLRQTPGYSNNAINNPNPYFPIDYDGRRPSWGLGDYAPSRRESLSGYFSSGRTQNLDIQYPQGQGNLNANNITPQYPQGQGNMGSSSITQYPQGQGNLVTNNMTTLTSQGRSQTQNALRNDVHSSSIGNNRPQHFKSSNSHPLELNESAKRSKIENNEVKQDDSETKQEARASNKKHAV